MIGNKGQVSFEYLLTVLFGVLLALAAAILASNITSIALVAKSRVLDYRESFITSITGG
ncbi:MAG: hypothetical protein ABH821_04250 [archaeon]